MCFLIYGIKLFQLKTFIFDQKLKNQTQKSKIGPKPKKSKFLFRGVVVFDVQPILIEERGDKEGRSIRGDYCCTE